MTLPAMVPVLSATPGATLWAGPALGEHTDEVRAVLARSEYERRAGIAVELDMRLVHAGGTTVMVMVSSEIDTVWGQRRVPACSLTSSPAAPVPVRRADHDLLRSQLTLAADNLPSC